jgi:hypothetical protein
MESPNNNAVVVHGDWHLSNQVKSIECHSIATVSPVRFLQDSHVIRRIKRQTVGFPPKLGMSLFDVWIFNILTRPTSAISLIRTNRTTLLSRTSSSKIGLPCLISRDSNSQSYHF